MSCATDLVDDPRREEDVADGDVEIAGIDVQVGTLSEYEREVTQEHGQLTGQAIELGTVGDQQPCARRPQQRRGYADTDNL